MFVYFSVFCYEMITVNIHKMHFMILGLSVQQMFCRLKNSIYALSTDKLLLTIPSKMFNIFNCSINVKFFFLTCRLLFYC